MFAIFDIPPYAALNMQQAPYFFDFPNFNVKNHPAKFEICYISLSPKSPHKQKVTTKNLEFW